MIRYHQRSLLAVYFLCDTEALRLFSSEGLTRNPSRILIGDVSQVFDFTQLDRSHIVQLEAINEMKILLGIIAFIEDQGQLRALRRVTKGVAEKIMKVLDHHRKLLGIMAVAVVDFIIQGHLAVGMAKQGIAHLAQIRATLFVFAAFRDIASPIKRINKGIK